LTKIRKSGIIAKYAYKRISIRVASFLAIKTRITPNQVTALSLILSLVAAPFLVSDRYFHQLSGGVILAAAFTLDYVDGDLARLKNLKSKEGEFFDVVSDRISIIVSILSLSIGLFGNSKNFLDLLLGVMVISLFYISDVADALLEKIYGGTLQKTYSFEIGLVNRLLRRLGLEINVYYFGEDFLYSLIIIGCVLNQVRLMLLLFTFSTSFLLTSCLYKVLKKRVQAIFVRKQPEY
jgi:phosphatidylglycerophosphate synthase